MSVFGAKFFGGKSQSSLGGGYAGSCYTKLLKHDQIYEAVENFRSIIDKLFEL
jgi:hypothetical protein